MPAIKYCQSYKTLMRYMDLGEIIKFIMFINKHPEYLKTERYTLTKYFRSIDMVTMVGIKEYYLKIFKNINPDKWTHIYQHFSKLENKQNLLTLIFILPQKIHILLLMDLLYSWQMMYLKSQSFIYKQQKYQNKLLLIL